METPGSLVHSVFVAPRVRRAHNAAIEAIRKRGTARVAIIVSSLSMWRLEDVYLKLKEDRRFDVEIILIPFAKQCAEEKEQEMQKLRAHLRSRGISYREESFFTEFDPDIIFYQQFYYHSYNAPVRACMNERKLLCYSPYGVMFIDKKWQYNSRFHNRAWKIFLQSQTHRNVAYRLADNHGRNVVVVGDADSDAFLRPDFHDIWKERPYEEKRIIWAPHHKKLGRDSFEWSAELMKSIAKEYEGRIQFAFKPHPRLKTELYKTEGWGPERTDEFYKFWEEAPNTQLETGSFIELFRGSDAMIHDCNSFIAEYMYTRKPALFLSGNTKKIRSSFGKFGKDALDAHYQGNSEAELRKFIEETVLSEQDPLKEKREAFYKEYLLPQDGKSFATLVVEDLRRSLWE